MCGKMSHDGLQIKKAMEAAAKSKGGPGRKQSHTLKIICGSQKRPGGMGKNKGKLEEWRK